ncbi:hypothetical protein RUM44_005383 [Polyplax serrata]|uniref:CUB domain-containing protein n=1 Tax=Polyplax serrata TaxID=468196 RepID=A0ABR1ADE4_POLSC
MIFESKKKQKDEFESERLSRCDKCDQTFVSRPNDPQNGTFTAPNLPNPDGHSRQCIYTFIAGPKQRVEIVFSHFSLRGTPPE